MVAQRADVAAPEAALQEVKRLYDAAYPVKEAGVFSEHDWNRCRRAVERIGSGTVLEVGVGPGQFLNMLSKLPAVTRLTGVDIKWNQKLLRPTDCDLQAMDILELKFEAASFDTVVCMEVLEHLEAIEVMKALSELRRVSRKTLIMTVPYNEPKPVWHHDKPGGHRQSFSEERIERMFPRAERTMIERGPGQCPWVMLVETRSEFVPSASSAAARRGST